MHAVVYCRDDGDDEVHLLAVAVWRLFDEEALLLPSDQFEQVTYDKVQSDVQMIYSGESVDM